MPEHLSAPAYSVIFGQSLLAVVALSVVLIIVLVVILVVILVVVLIIVLVIVVRHEDSLPFSSIFTRFGPIIQTEDGIVG